jgi:hypothetical protein
MYKQPDITAKAGKSLLQSVHMTEVFSARPLGLLAGKAQESADCWSTDPVVEEWFYAATGVADNDVKLLEA